MSSYQLVAACSDDLTDWQRCSHAHPGGVHYSVGSRHASPVCAMLLSQKQMILSQNLATAGPYGLDDEGWQRLAPARHPGVFCFAAAYLL